MYVLIFFKTYIQSWKIHTYGLNNIILDTYVRSTYDLKNMMPRQGRTAMDGCQWTDVYGRKGPDGRNQIDGYWQNYDERRWMATAMDDDDNGARRHLWRTAIDSDNDNDNDKWRQQWTTMTMNNNSDKWWR